ncbi:MAG: DUF3459 domain-containing protein [Candidatus Syntrophosphaera sp.]|nr:DUF3459 domain-containing protein [Candidatus Syntrophosphaera sp.]
MADIRFRYQPPTAGTHEVGIAGDFTSWEILDLIDVGGIYLISLHVEKGRYRYKFIVDGNWIADPNNPNLEADPFGGMNSILVVDGQKKPRFAWKDIWQDQAPLRERLGHYISVNRMAENLYELRFNWHPSLPAELVAKLDGKDTQLFRLGVHANREVWHCCFASARDSLDVWIAVKAEGHVLYLGEEVFSEQLGKLNPIRIQLRELPVFAVPDWVRDSVIYQIFPDRFHNGDPSLNPDFSESWYDDCREPPPDGEFLPPHREYYHLVRDWTDISGLRQSPWLEPGKPDWWSFYGGDIPGVHQKLDYLKDLGITVIYFNPLWQAKSNHKYDAADFRKIDPHFGSTQVLQALVREAHETGIRIIVDIAFNHCGDDFWAFRDTVQKGPASEYWSWFDWVKWPLPEPLPPDFKPKEYYQCWWGIKDMPDLNFDLSRTHPSENYVKDIYKAVPNQPLVEHILDCVRWWLLEIGIDGFRLDVPDEVPYWFWQLFREQVKAIKPEAWIVGEIWQSARGWVGPNYFDSVMNYACFKDPLLEFFILRLIDCRGFRAKIEEGLAQYPFQALGAMMNLLGSHDTVRVLELAKGNISRLKLALLFQMTFSGAPHIYYGDEIAMRGGKDPDNRRPFNWAWEQDPEASDLREFYRELIRLRKCHTLLREGEFSFLEVPDGLLAWQRYDSLGRIIVILNYSTASHVQGNPEAGETLFTLGDVVPRSDGFLLPPDSGVVFLNQ